MFDSMPIAVDRRAGGQPGRRLAVGRSPARPTPPRTATPAPASTARPTTARAFQRVGDDSSGNNPLVSRTIFKLAFDSNGHGLRRHRQRPVPRWRTGATHVDRGAAPAGADDFPPYDHQVTSVAVVPGTGGQDVIAASAGAARATPRTTASTSRPTAARPSRRSPRPARSTPATSDGPRSPTPPTARSSTRSSSRRPAGGGQRVGAAGHLRRQRARRPAWPGPGPRSPTRRSSPLPARRWPSAPATASACRPGTTRTWRSTRPTPTTSTPGSRRSSSPPTAADVDHREPVLELRPGLRHVPRRARTRPIPTSTR